MFGAFRLSLQTLAEKKESLFVLTITQLIDETKIS